MKNVILTVRSAEMGGVVAELFDGALYLNPSYPIEDQVWAACEAIELVIGGVQPAGGRRRRHLQPVGGDQ